MNTKVNELHVIQMLERIDDESGLLTDLKKAVHEVSTAVNDGKKGGVGAVTLTIKMTKTGKSQVEVVDEVTCKKPKVVKDGVSLFVHPNGGLTVENPLQHSLDMDDDKVAK